jgi:hypothetical protein
MTEAPLLKLEEVCRQQKVMLVMARSYGLAGLVRLSFTVRIPGDDFQSSSHTFSFELFPPLTLVTPVVVLSRIIR